MYYDEKEELKELFLDWLGNFDAVSDEEELLDQLANCGDWLPEGVCNMLGVSTGSSYADAAKLFRSEWVSD
jgi:hypothetical protein